MHNNSSVDVRLLSKVSSLYYENNLNQREIADKLQLSRPKVSRLLKQAKQQNIVQISVVTRDENFIELENELETRYGLKEVIITDSDPDMSDKLLKKRIGSAAAQYFYRTIQEDELIGVTWGTTLQSMLDAMQPKQVNNVHIIQTLGGIGPPEDKAHAADISRRLSQIFNAQLSLLPTPGIVGSSQAKNVLQEDRQVNNSLRLFSKISTLYVGIGALETNPVLTKNQNEISEEEYYEIMESDAVGDIALRFFDRNGREVDTSLKDLVIGITIGEIRNVDNVIGIAGGVKKVNAIHGALRGNLIDVLITDRTTATHILNDT